MIYTIGLTGGIGSGKTLISDHFKSLGVPIIDTDIIARQIVAPKQPVLAALTEAFGESILHSDGSLNRDALRKLAFSSQQNKAQLDAITHPAILQQTRLQIAQANYPYCIVVVPLLTESYFKQLMQRILVVIAETNIKIKRIKKRSNLSTQEIKRIMASQVEDKERLKYADDVVENNATIADAQQHVEKLHLHYLKLTRSHTPTI